MSKLAALKAEGKRIAERIEAIGKDLMDGDGGVKLATDEAVVTELKDLGAQLDTITSQVGVFEGGEVFLSGIKREIESPPPVSPASLESKSLAEQILGPRDEYKGLAHWTPTMAGQLIEGTQHKTAFTSTSSNTGALLPAADRRDPMLMPVRRLSVRDAFFMPGSTTSPLVEYFELTTDTNNAAGVSENAQKPEDAFQWTLRQSNVRTIATTLPVTEQILADYGQMVTALQNRMGYHVDFEEEVQLMWGSGAPDLTGIMNTSGVQDASTACSIEAADTYIDIVRKMITAAWSGNGAMAEGFYPSAVGMTPLVKQDIDLLKDNNGNYLFAVVQNASGMRVWGLEIVESNAFRDPADLNDHYIMVGSKQAAQIWDRESLNFAVGLVGDDFRYNRKTLRVEKRLASGLYDASSFIYYQLENIS